jgi:diguanylate cyclase (GGDEF)-like protein/PAS domain S-box-containing protein
MSSGMGVARHVDQRIRIEDEAVPCEVCSRFLEHSPDVLFTADPTGVLTWVSPASREVTGHEPSELVGHRPTDFSLDEPEQSRLAASIEKLAAGGVEEHEGRMLCADGTAIWTSVRVRPVFDADGKMVQAFGVLRDITAVVEARRARATSESHLRLLMEHVSDAVFLTDDDAVILWVSASVERIYGWTPDEMIGTRTTDYLHPDDMASRAEGLAAMDAGRAVHEEMRLRAKDGGYRWADLTGRTIRDVEGRIVNRVTTVRDVQESVEARTVLTASEQHYRLLAENATDVLAHIRDGVVLWVSENLPEVLGWSPERWVGHRIDEFVVPEDRAVLDEVRSAELRTGVQVFRLRAQPLTGEPCWIEVHRRRYVDADGSIDGVQVSFRQVDAEVEAERALEHQARTDSLTGLPNRRSGLEGLAQRMATHRRHGDQLAVAFCDVDGFKEINDRHGHAVGDEVLRGVAARVRASVRATDTVSRVGGDELLVVMTGISDAEHGRAVVDKISGAFGVPIETSVGALPITLSIGLVMATPGESVDDVVDRADRVMYEVKRARVGG